MSLFQMSVAGGVLILFIVVIRALAIHRLPKTTFLALWMIAALRLLLPFSIPLPFNIHIGLDVFSDVVQELPSGNIGSPLPGENLPSYDTGAAAPSPATEHISTFEILWLVGVLLLALYFFISYFRSMQKFRMSIPDNTPYIREWLTTHQITRSIEARSSDLISSPLTYGILHPVILLPKKLDRNDQAALKYVLTHEYVHIRRFDAITKLLFAAVLCIHWFNPLAWVLYVLANRDVELSCDAWVIRMMGAKNRSSYALMLIKMEERRNGMSALYSHFGKNAISERIEAIMKFKKTSTIACALALVLVVGATTAFANSDVNHENTDTAQFVGYTRNLGNGTEYSVDNGETWISEEKYNELYPQLDIVYWTYEEYKEYLEEQIPVWQSLIGAKYKNVKGEWVEWTQETVYQCIAQAEEELEAIKNGALVSRTIDGVNDPNFSITINNLNSDVDVTYTTTIIDQKGQEINLGSFSTEEERLTAVQDYCDEQIRLGNMTKEYAENLINDFQ